ncbi:hypothetical protein [Idiomarina abyssalis]|uniref:hypothetical protein n=1 Tax=Idiomarina abyssalis TaxID=86102 RepID=UPI003A955C89
MDNAEDKSHSPLRELHESLKFIVERYLGEVAHDVLTDIIEYELVNVAHRRALQKDNRLKTQSHIGFVTGLSPERIRKVLNQSARDICNPILSVEQRIIHTWCTHEDYIDECNGRPKKLLISGPGQTFQGLINRIARGVTTKTVIQSFTQKSLISINQRYWVSLHVNNAVELFDLPISPQIVR